jgi:putative aminopeptidase FrvX
LVSVICRHEDGRLLKVSGNLEEIGESSALVLTESGIQVGTKVVVDCKTHQLRGVVESRWLDEHLGFFVEIRLNSGSQWSQRWFAPEHLLPFFKAPA